jgi:hypothetical protein
MFLQINKVRYLEKYLTAFLCSLSKQTPTMSRAFDQISKVNDTKIPYFFNLMKYEDIKAMTFREDVLVGKFRLHMRI